MLGVVFQEFQLDAFYDNIVEWFYAYFFCLIDLSFAKI